MTPKKTARKTKTKKTKVKKTKAVKKKTELEELMEEMMARFDGIENKISALISKISSLALMISTERDAKFTTHATVSKKFPEIKDRPPRKRRMYKAVCADCNTACEVPFEPRPDRPVYCKDCYSRNRNTGMQRNIPAKEEMAAEIAKTLNIAMPGLSGKKSAKTGTKKRPSTAKTTGKKKSTSKRPASKTKKKRR